MLQAAQDIPPQPADDTTYPLLALQTGNQAEAPLTPLPAPMAACLPHPALTDDVVVTASISPGADRAADTKVTITSLLAPVFEDVHLPASPAPSPRK